METNDLLQRNMSTLVDREELEEIQALCEAHEVPFGLPDETLVVSYNEKLTDEGLEGHFLWGGDREVCDWEQRIEYAEFKRRLINSLPMLREAGDKRGFHLYLKLTKQRAAYARKQINLFLRGKAKGDVALLRHAMEVLDQVKTF